MENRLLDKPLSDPDSTRKKSENDLILKILSLKSPTHLGAPFLVRYSIILRV